MNRVAGGGFISFIGKGQNTALSETSVLVSQLNALLPVTRIDCLTRNFIVRIQSSVPGFARSQTDFWTNARRRPLVFANLISATSKYARRA